MPACSISTQFRRRNQGERSDEVIWKGTTRRTLFILGAGATRGSFRHVIVNGKRIQAPVNRDFFRVAERFVRGQGPNGGLQGRYKRIRNVFRDEFPTRGKWPIPMEEAFSLLYVSKDFPEIYLPRRGRRRTAGTRREIEDFLRLTFGILSAIEERVPPNNLYARLVSSLQPGDTLLTLNYDTLLDSALVNGGWDPAIGYDLIAGKAKITWARNRPAPSKALEGVKLLKLHGSLNWYVRGSFKKLARIFETKPTRVLISQRPRTNEYSGLVRQIVPPIYGKFFAHRHWRRLWGAAHAALIDAEALVIIRCSLVPTDFHLSGMLSHAIEQRKSDNNPFQFVTAVDRARIRRKWLTVVKGCFRMKLEYPSFAQFARRQLLISE
jgi:hypothetical protein